MVVRLVRSMLSGLVAAAEAASVCVEIPKTS